MDAQAFIQSAIPLVTLFGLKVIGALAIWIVGRKLIQVACRLVVRSLRYPFDPTVAAYVGTAVSVLLTIGLILAVLGFFGVETTSFAALRLTSAGRIASGHGFAFLVTASLSAW